MRDHGVEGVGEIDAEDLLALLDADNVHDVGRDEVGFSCFYVAGHAHGDRNPSAHVNRDSLLWRCLAGETKVITSHGRVPISKLAGRQATILTAGGRWRKTRFYALGQQRLWVITLSRNGVKQTVRATAEHRWFLESRRGKRQERLTSELLSGDSLQSVFPCHRPSGRGLHVSASGVMHGFTYGDGTLEGYNGHRGYGSRAYLFPPKDDAMRAWFGMHKMQTREDDGRVIVFGLPRSFRSLPKLSEGASYLYGWLAGYFAADGTVSKGGQLELDSASYESLEHVQAVCDLLGIGTSTIRSYERDGQLERINSTGVGCGVRPIHRMRLFGLDITPEFLLLPHHLANFIAHKREYERTRWTVVDVQETDAVEEVYCCEVPETGSFAIDGNILTGNCKSCGRAGNLLELTKLALPQGTTHVEALRWLRENFGETARRPVGGSLTADLTARLERARGRLDIPPRIIPNEAETIGPEGIFHVDWRSDHEAAIYMRGRGFAPEVLEDWGLGFDTWTQRVTIAVHDEVGTLVGFKGRALDDRPAKYLLLGDTEGRGLRYGQPWGWDMHDARKVVFGLDRARGCKRVVLVEGELNVIACAAAGVAAVAPGTTSITDEQLWLLRAHFDELVFFYDSDVAGENAVWGYVDPDSGKYRPGLVEKIKDYFRLYVVDDHDGDPASMAPDEIRALVADARHWLGAAFPSGAGV